MRKRLFEIIEAAEEGDRASEIYDACMIALIVLSLVPLAFKTESAALLFCILASAARQRDEQTPGRILNARDFSTQTAVPTATPRKVTAVQLPTPTPAPTVEILPLGAADVADIDVGDRSAEPTPTPEASHRYVLNTSSKKFHKPGCSSVGKMSDQNKREVIGPRSELIAEGYSPCGVCNP